MTRKIMMGLLALAMASPALAQTSSDEKPHASAAKGAVVGGVAGHMMGHHAVAGAAAGALVGHHMRKKEEQKTGGG